MLDEAGGELDESFLPCGVELFDVVSNDIRACDCVPFAYPNIVVEDVNVFPYVVDPDFVVLVSHLGVVDDCRDCRLIPFRLLDRVFNYPVVQIAGVGRCRGGGAVIERRGLWCGVGARRGGFVFTV